MTTSALITAVDVDDVDMMIMPPDSTDGTYSGSSSAFLNT